MNLVEVSSINLLTILKSLNFHIAVEILRKKYGTLPTLVFSDPTLKAETRFSKKSRTSLKLNLPILQEPSTSMTISAIAGVLQVNWLPVNH